MIATINAFMHNCHVIKALMTGICSPNRRRRTNRRNGGIFSSKLCALLWAAVAGGFGLPVSYVTGLQTCYLPPTPFCSGKRSNRHRSAK